MRSALAPPTTLASEQMTALRAEVRAFLADEIAAGRLTPWIDTWLTKWDEDFTRRLAERGWVGMTIPTEYGGRGRTFLERFVVTEELLSVGAPVAAQWVADRQIAPSLLRYGTEEQKREYLPRIAAGECCFGIGMSEPGSGSDLASVRTKGVKVDGGWSITGTKVWTSGAQHAEAFIALCRTEPLDTTNRHAGLSQFIVDLRGEGVTVRPIVSLSGDHHFNEVILDEVFVPDAMVFGALGNGWEQVNSELAFERSGPERFLSSFRLFAAEIGAVAEGALPARLDLGRSVARMAGLHSLSQNIAGALQRGEPADTAAALVKLLGTTTEGDLVDAVSTGLGDEFRPGDGDAAASELADLLRAGLHQRPGFTLRGGTNEILRGVIARGLGMR
ncbi:acyl-CoA dehydrogenase family protein [Dietzia cinnamea]|uniref:acyl-CoA dehydrogenase family protein n=1 Tax=Dietzia cinnamea TaxID=321318 RepID=UPI000D60FF70|nr:acyl-CoA dehydrogenase family protein [Dietzia cinnamea]PWD97021.1 acyl-CoA dehydrogenase [Dietzia maris]MBM7230461.1 acyl-CoA dehydrogenase family protein [Dietzia cinnamea]MCT2061710.1 acyl-CoA dehydrogenase family protein [Dietzia cinnamea]MCT2174032.1 acyl-CoA dehydrogenase family protein [Dietzia cinnamea]MCT2236030.1 acyl-CoA dehydrogenase family protein [Dietzia cinnamea]